MKCDTHMSLVLWNKVGLYYNWGWALCCTRLCIWWIKQYTLLMYCTDRQVVDCLAVSPQFASLGYYCLVDPSIPSLFHSAFLLFDYVEYSWKTLILVFLTSANNTLLYHLIHDICYFKEINISGRGYPSYIPNYRWLTVTWIIVFALNWPISWAYT